MGSNANRLYTSAGLPAAGSFGRSSVVVNEFDAIETGFKKLETTTLQVYFEDANNGAQVRAVPWLNNRTGIITRLTAINMADNAGAECVLTARIGTVAITHPTWRFEASLAAFTGRSVVPTNNNALFLGFRHVRIESNGGGSSVMPVMVLIEIAWEALP